MHYHVQVSVDDAEAHAPISRHRRATPVPTVLIVVHERKAADAAPGDALRIDGRDEEPEEPLLPAMRKRLRN